MTDKTRLSNTISSIKKLFNVFSQTNKNYKQKQKQKQEQEQDQITIQNQNLTYSKLVDYLTTFTKLELVSCSIYINEENYELVRQGLILNKTNIVFGNY
jgi:carbonic anhydrase